MVDNRLDWLMPCSFDEICGLSTAFSAGRAKFRPIDIAFLLFRLIIFHYLRLVLRVQKEGLT